MMRIGAMAAGFALLCTLTGTAHAGAIGGERNGFDDERPCIELRQQSETARRVGGFVMPGDGSSLGVAPILPTRSPVDDVPLATDDCIVHGEAVLQDLTELALFESVGVAPEGPHGSIADWAIAQRARTTTGDNAEPQAGESLLATLSHYVVEVPRQSDAAPTGAVGDGGSPLTAAEVDLDLFGVDGRHFDGLLDQSVWRELLVSVLEPAIGTSDHDTFSFLGIGQFRLEFDRATSSLQLIEAESRTSVALTAGDSHAVGLTGGGQAVRFSGSSMSTEELVAYMAGRLFSSPWLYVCVLGGLAGIALVRLRRLRA